MECGNGRGFLPVLWAGNGGLEINIAYGFIWFCGNPGGVVWRGFPCWRRDSGLFWSIWEINKAQHSINRWYTFALLAGNWVCAAGCEAMGVMGMMRVMGAD